MIKIVPILSSVLFTIATSLVLIIVLIKFYIKIREKFPISVNCWFCNTWSKVAYNDREAFDCPNCLQYNGFGKDGGFNKIIPEQHDELLNRNTRAKTKNSGATNGLCGFCNNNQQLKIFQLANFVPMVEDNYDAEIEHFQEQLEKAYKLCKKCDRVLKNTIDSQNAWLFGDRIKNIYKKGLSSITNTAKSAKTESILLVLNRYLSVLLTLTVFFLTICHNKFIMNTLIKYLPQDYKVPLSDLLIVIKTAKPIEINFFYWAKVVKVDKFVLFGAGGLSAQLIATLGESHDATVKLNRLLCWVILLLTSGLRLGKNYSTYMWCLQIFCCSYLLYNSITAKRMATSGPNKRNKGTRKFVKNLEYTCSDLSDCDDEINDISTSSTQSLRSYHTQQGLSPPSSVKSTASNYTHLLNQSFVTATSDPKISNNHFQTGRRPVDVELNKSMDNLHLGGLSYRPSYGPSPSFSVVSSVGRPKPVLSPAKLQPIHNNSWVAGGFWRNIDGVLMPASRPTNLSRSSSESSGFGSQHNDNPNVRLFGSPSPPPPKNPPAYYEFDRRSILSEPPFGYKRLNNSFHGRKSPYDNTLNQSPVFPNIGANFQENRGIPRPPRESAGGETYQRGSLIKNWPERFSPTPVMYFRDLSFPNNFVRN